MSSPLICAGLILRASVVAQTVKNLPAMQKTLVQSLAWEAPLEKGMATHSSILAWRMPWTEEPGGLQSMRLQRVGHNWVTNIRGCTHMGLILTLNFCIQTTLIHSGNSVCSLKGEFFVCFLLFAWFGCAKSYLSCTMRTLSCSMQDLVRSPGIEPGTTRASPEGRMFWVWTC